MNWEIRFYLLLVVIVSYCLGKMRGRADTWIYIGPDSNKVDNAVLGIQLKSKGEQSMNIVITDCHGDSETTEQHGNCPFEYDCECTLLQYQTIANDGVLEDCPLKKGPITVQFKENSND